MSDAMKQHGAFSWNELMTSDVAAAKSFYEKLFDWTLEDQPTCEFGYTMAKAGDTPVAGIMGMPPEAGDMPPIWGAYVTVDDVDKSAALAESLGGTIMLAPRDIPNVGRFCVIGDPQGVAISLITYYPNK